MKRLASCVAIATLLFSQSSSPNPSEYAFFLEEPILFLLSPDSLEGGDVWLSFLDREQPSIKLGSYADRTEVIVFDLNDHLLICSPVSMSIEIETKSASGTYSLFRQTMLIETPGKDIAGDPEFDEAIRMLRSPKLRSKAPKEFKSKRLEEAIIKKKLLDDLQAPVHGIETAILEHSEKLKMAKHHQEMMPGILSLINAAERGTLSQSSTSIKRPGRTSYQKDGSAGVEGIAFLGPRYELRGDFGQKLVTPINCDD